MGTASEGSDAGGIVGDCGVGTIVWVRRRNGSWWPGRILGPEELADSHVVSSRLGTPVKLLGREDASVDWYNLEKSKRVKPFRCGEFDACIERAETSHSTPIKKREKYARREDAILHALELEKQQLEMQQESTAISCHAPNKTIGLSERGSNHYSSELNVSNMSQTSSRKISPLLDECHLDHPLPIHGNRNIKMRISEEEKHEISTHISVEDVSPEVSKSKGKVFLSVVGGNSDITDDDHSDLIPDSAQNSGFISQAVVDKNFSVFKRKILLPSAINDSPTKKRDRRRPLVKVLQNSTKLPVSYSFQPHHDCSGSLMPSEEHLISKAHGTQKNTLHQSLDVDDPLDYSSHSWKHTTVDSGNAYQLQQPRCLSNESTPSRWTEENDFDSSATDSEPEMVEEKLRSGITQPLKHTAESSIESGMSHWHLKGKRNNRVISKRLHKYGDGNKLDGANNSNVLFMETSPKGKATTSYNIGKFDSSTTPNVLGPEFSSEKEIDYDSEDEEIFTGLGNKRDDLERQHSDYIDSDDDEQLISEPGWGPMRPFQIWKAYWDDPEDNLDQFCAPPFGYRMIPMLIDVDLKVQARYHGEHVPLISLMSKLNGMAIVGHPVHIEVLEDGSTDLLLPSMEFGDTAASPIWRTAKRTSMHRLPRSIPDPPNSSYVDDKSQSDLQAPTAKKRFYHAHRSASGRFQRKPLKTVSLFSSQKTRALSSFVREKKHNSRDVFLDGLIKADESMPPVTCIPAKVVFSRILESLGRPSAHRAIAARAAERGPS